MKISKGATFVAQNLLSVSDFFARGAAFGLQARERVDKHDVNELWNDDAIFLVDQVGLSNTFSEQLPSIRG